MDAHRFDNLTRVLARGTTRRRVLKGLACSLLGGVSAGGLAGVSAQRRRNQAVGFLCRYAAECASHSCVDGVCCDSPCTGQCESCVSGVCQPVVGAPVDNRQPCAGSGPCQAICDGSTTSHCAGWPGAETGCGDATCAGGMLTTYACGGNGACHPTTTSCGLYACGPSGCLSTCAGDGDCVGTAYCVGGVCQADPPFEPPCERSDQCPSGSACVDGVCQRLDPCAGIDCDGGDPCTVDQCRDGTCTHTPIAGCCIEDGQCPSPDDPCLAGACVGRECRVVAANDGGPCDDGDACTETDTCHAGACVGSDPVVCQALDQCHEAGVCNRATGQCSDPPVRDGTLCDDDDGCTRRDTCRDGVCTGGNPVVCKDPPAPCFVPATCDPATGACPDPVLAAGSCFIAGVCLTAGAAHKKDLCQVCDPTQSTIEWSAAADGVRCSDDNACTATDTCQKGVCTPGTEVVCQALDDCHDAGVCDPATGQCSQPLKLDGESCDDHDPCTIDDACAAGVCIGKPRDCSALNGPCTWGVCNSLTGECETAARREGEPCEDGDRCTQGSICQDGACVGGEQIICSPPDVCHTAVCVLGSSGCVVTAKADGTSCGDSQYCFDGACETCRVGGKECDDDAQCCSGNCLGGFCECKPFGGTCGVDVDCCRGLCIEGSCGCAGSGASCVALENCCSSMCSDAGVCECAHTGSHCQTPEDCCNGLCEGGVCRCRAKDQACGADADCCEGPCLEGTCGCRDFFESCTRNEDCCDGVCTQGQCTCTRRNFECAADGECCSNDCNDAGICGCSPIGSRCIFSLDCCRGFCGGNGTCFCRAAGDNCRVDQDCCDGVCLGGVCGCRGISESCDEVRDCCSDVCDAGECSCRLEGEQCNADNNCCDFASSCCGGACVDLDSSKEHCGACFSPVPDGFICNNGEPLLLCGPFFTACGGSCVSLDFDDDHCGECFNPCDDDETCVARICVPDLFG